MHKIPNLTEAKSKDGQDVAYLDSLFTEMDLETILPLDDGIVSVGGGDEWDTVGEDDWLVALYSQ